MGMFNEVYDECPECGRTLGYAQISQVILGFGEFPLHDLPSIQRRMSSGELSREEVSSLADKLEDPMLYFHCERQFDSQDEEEGCCASWNPDPAKVIALRLIASQGDPSTLDRARQILREQGSDGF